VGPVAPVAPTGPVGPVAPPPGIGLHSEFPNPSDVKTQPSGKPSESIHLAVVRAIDLYLKRYE